MGCTSSKPATVPSSAPPPQEMGRPPARAPAPPTPVHPSQQRLAPVLVPSPEGTSGTPAHHIAPPVGETSSPKPSAVQVERKRSRATPRPSDSGGYPSSPPGSSVVVVQQPHLSEMDTSQHQPRKRVASKLGKSPSMDLLGGRSHPPDRIMRTASTSVIPNTYPPVDPRQPPAGSLHSPAGPLHPPAGPIHPPAGPLYPPAGPLFQPQPVSRAGYVQAKRQETRPQFPPNLQSLLSNDFRYVVRRCPISHYYYSTIVHRFRILVAGRVRVVDKQAVDAADACFIVAGIRQVLPHQCRFQCGYVGMYPVIFGLLLHRLI